MPVNPKFLAARAAERRHRDIAHVRALAWLPLKCGAITVRTPVVPLTLRHRLDLRLQRNAFFFPAPVLRGDVFLFLWRLHPLYRAPRYLQPPENRRLDRLRRLWGCLLLPLAFNLGSLRAALAHRRLNRLARQCSLSGAIASIGEFMAVAGQDRAPAKGDAAPGNRRRVGLAAPESCAADNAVDYLMTIYGMSHDEALDLPIAVANQLHRERLLQGPDGELEVFSPSDALLAQ